MNDKDMLKAVTIKNGVGNIDGFSVVLTHSVLEAYLNNCAASVIGQTEGTPICNEVREEVGDLLTSYYSGHRSISETIAILKRIFAAREISPQN